MEDPEVYQKLHAEQYRSQFAQRQLSPIRDGSGSTDPSQRPPPPPGPASPVETVLDATAELTGQVERLVDDLHSRLRSLVQDIPVNVAKPSELPPPSCPLVGQLLEHAGHLERLSLQLQTLVQQLAL